MARLQRAVGNRATARLVPRLLARQPRAGTGAAAGSRLVGLHRKLEWSEFSPRPANDPVFNRIGFAAILREILTEKAVSF